MGTQQTLHDFTLNLLGDLDARQAFQADPEGALEAAGLGDISPVDIHEILPLVLDTASVANVDVLDKVLVAAGDLDAVDSLKLIAGNVGGVTDVVGLASPTAVTALVSDVAGVGVGDVAGLGDVSSTLDATVLKATDVVSTVSTVAPVTSAVTDVVDVHNVTDGLVGDLDTDVLVKDVVDADTLVKTVSGVTDVADLHDIADVTDVVQNVGQIGDVHHVVGDLNVGNIVGNVGNIGDLDLDVLDHGVGNGNDVAFHL
ncbi:IniB N-terminal domain-containing protein [Lentzea sp. NPDC059081]|uniref:IniB N-terminal domain-containing protein n=1 Tax=Lentzea sp. NPDC059081 TaxID=3346719 RepID=UPI0036A4E7E1